MTPAQTFLAAIAVAFISGPIWPIVLPRILEWKNRRREIERREELEEIEQRENERDQWMEDAREAYDRVNKSCERCHKELERLRRDELEPLKRDHAAMKEALLGRIEVLDEILPFVTNLPPARVQELKDLNRAQRRAVFRAEW